MCVFKKFLGWILCCYKSPCDHMMLFSHILWSHLGTLNRWWRREHFPTRERTTKESREWPAITKPEWRVCEVTGLTGCERSCGKKMLMSYCYILLRPSPSKVASKAFKIIHLCIYRWSSYPVSLSLYFEQYNPVCSGAIIVIYISNSP